MLSPKDLDIDDIPSQVTATLADYFAERRSAVEKIGGPVGDALGYLERFVLRGGKRIRPLYAWAGFIGAGGLRGNEDPQAVLQACASLEFIQACALIHDDIIDASDSRRGAPTVHRQAEALHRDHDWNGDSAEFGTSMAILVGDLALAWAEDMVQDSGLSAEALRRIRAPWRAMRTEVIGGQMLDISLEAMGAESIELAGSVNRFKTAAYTIERPLHLGAALADGTESITTAFRQYGADIGVAFQLRDDLLGVYGDPDVTGKPAGDDLREGKLTVLLITAVQRIDESDPDTAAWLRSRVGATEDPAEIKRMAEVIAESGAPEAMEHKIDALTRSGMRTIHDAGLDKWTVRVLEELGRKATARRK